MKVLELRDKSVFLGAEDSLNCRRHQPKIERIRLSSIFCFNLTEEVQDIVYMISGGSAAALDVLFCDEELMIPPRRWCMGLSILCAAVV